MPFILFLLVNATLFLRPSELMPDLAEVPIYNILILATLAVAAPLVARRLDPKLLASDPATVCVLGLLPAIVLSNLANNFDTYMARMNAWDFSKTVIYYLLLVSVVDSPRRLRSFLYTIAFLAAANSTIAILHHFEIINVEALRVVLEDQRDPITGEAYQIKRLAATGIFNDPNDLALIDVFGMTVSLLGLFDKRAGLFRTIWLGPLGVFFFALLLTQSRGGFLAFLVMAGTLSYFRFGLFKTGLAAVVLLPALLVVAGGRQADIGGGMSAGTGNQRVQFWMDGLIALKQQPVFGVGFGNYGEYTDGHHVAHNSFVHCFVEMGLLGGALFLGIFLAIGFTLWKLGRRFNSPLRLTADPAFRRMQPYVLAMLTGVTASLMTISRSYVASTYLVLGVANVYCLLSQRQGVPALVVVNPRWLGALAVASLAFLVVIFAFIKWTIRY